MIYSRGSSDFKRLTKRENATVRGVVSTYGKVCDKPDGLIVVGDRIIGLGATRVDDAADLIMALEAHRPGDQAELHIRRGDQRKSLKITLGGTR